MQMSKIFKELINNVCDLGADNAKVINTDKIVTDVSFRKMCEVNTCGQYGRCWMCPPDVGEISMLMKRIKSYNYSIVYQKIFPLEDNFDFEGMLEAKKKHLYLSQSIKIYLLKNEINDFLCLSTGGCGVCEKCAKIDNHTCRYPDKAIASLEAYGIDVSHLAKSADMKYINGPDTVTYFGMILFNLN